MTATEHRKDNEKTCKDTYREFQNAVPDTIKLHGLYLFVLVLETVSCHVPPNVNVNGLDWSPVNDLDWSPQ